MFVVFNSRGEAVTLGLNQGKFDVVRAVRNRLDDCPESVPRPGQAGRSARGGEARTWPSETADADRVDAPGEEGREVSRCFTIAVALVLAQCRLGICPV